MLSEAALPIYRLWAKASHLEMHLLQSIWLKYAWTNAAALKYEVWLLKAKQKKVYEIHEMFRIPSVWNGIV